MNTSRLLGLTLTLAILGGAVQGQAVSTDKSTYVVGERVRTSFDTSTTTTDWVGIYDAGAPGGGAVPSTYWQYTNGLQSPGSSVIPSGTLTFLPFSLPPGAYDCRYFANDGYTVLDQVTFGVVEGSISPAPPPIGELTVISFNIWVNGGGVPNGLDQVREAIVKTQPDIIGLQESSSATTSALLALLQTAPHYTQAQAQASTAASVISRFPISAEYLASGLRGYGVRVDLPSGQGVRFFNSHLTAYPYGPYTVRDGGSLAQVLADEQATRLPEAQAILSTLIDAPANDPDLPTFFVGDHNSPSGLDWTAANSLQNFGWTLDWPVASLVRGAGFLDLYRESHLDPAGERGFTWSPGYPKNTLDQADVHDRIDMIYFRPAAGAEVRVLKSYAFDEDPWPADHRAVVVSIELASGPGTAYCSGDGAGTPCPCGNNNDGSMSGCDWNGGGLAGGALTATGSDVYASSDTFLEATNVSGDFGVFFSANREVMGRTLDDGLRCAGSGLIRMTPPIAPGGSTATHAVPLQSLDAGAGIGTTRYYQYWFRTDPDVCGNLANTTNGYAIAWMP